MKTVLLSLFAFIVGSIPTGLVIAKMRGVDLRKAGSGNIGATNVLRTAGKWPAALTLAGDMLKGSIVILIARWFGIGMLPEGVVGLCAILGHNFSIFLRFRGGKGVATSIGVLCIYAPQTCIVTIIIWLMTVLVTRYSSLGALVAFVSMPLVLLLLDSGKKLPIALMMVVMLFIRHKDNIGRLIRGKESRIGRP